MAQQRKGDRVTNPSWDDARKRWRVPIIRGDGTRRCRSFKSESAAWEYKEAADAQVSIDAGRTIGQAIDAYQEYLTTEKGNKLRSIVTTRYRLEVFFPNQEQPIADLRGSNGQELYDRLRLAVDNRGNPVHSADSHRNCLAEAKTFLRWCLARNLVRVNVLENVVGVGRRNKGADKPQLRIDEARRFEESALHLGKRGWDGATAALMALYFDMRSEEIVVRRVRDLDDGGMVLWIPASKTPAGRRQLPIPTQELWEMLQRAIRGKAPTDYLLGDGKKPRDRNWVRKSANKISRRARVPEVGAHGLRRTHATFATEGGMTPHAIALAMGHQSFATTKASYIARGTVEKMGREKVLGVLHGGRRGPQRAPEHETEDEPKERKA